MNTLRRVRTGPGKSLHLQNLVSRPERSLNSGTDPGKSWNGNSQLFEPSAEYRAAPVQRHGHRLSYCAIASSSVGH